MGGATVSVAEARNNFSRLSSAVVETGEPVTVFRNSRPWVVISPAEPPARDYDAEVEAGVVRSSRDIAEGRWMGLDEFLRRSRG